MSKLVSSLPRIVMYWKESRESKVPATADGLATTPGSFKKRSVAFWHSASPMIVAGIVLKFLQMFSFIA